MINRLVFHRFIDHHRLPLISKASSDSRLRPLRRRLLEAQANYPIENTTAIISLGLLPGHRRLSGPGNGIAVQCRQLCTLRIPGRAARLSSGLSVIAGSYWTAMPAIGTSQGHDPNVKGSEVRLPFLLIKNSQASAAVDSATDVCD